MRAPDFPSQTFSDLDYNTPRRGNRSTRQYLQRRSLKRRLTKASFLAVVAVVSLLAGYLLAN